MLSVSQSTVARIECGDQNVTIGMLDRICRALGCDVGDLFEVGAGEDCRTGRATGRPGPSPKRQPGDDEHDHHTSRIRVSTAAVATWLAMMSGLLSFGLAAASAITIDIDEFQHATVLLPFAPQEGTLFLCENPSVILSPVGCEAPPSDTVFRAGLTTGTVLLESDLPEPGTPAAPRDRALLIPFPAQLQGLLLDLDRLGPIGHARGQALAAPNVTERASASLENPSAPRKTLEASLSPPIINRDVAARIQTEFARSLHKGRRPSLPWT